MAARGGVNSKGEAVPQPVKVQRYWPGKVPEGIKDYSSDEEEDEQFERERETEIITSIEKVDITEKEAASDRRLRRLKEAKEAGSSEVIDRRRRHFKEEDQEVDLPLRTIKIEQDAEVRMEEEEEEDDLALRRQRLRDRVLEQRKQEEEKLKAIEEAEKAQASQTEEEGSESEETSEYETDSEEEQASRKLLKPVFIPKAHRETILEKERKEKLEEETEAKRLQELEERKKESHSMVAEVIQKELQKTVDEETGIKEVDDTDGLDEQAEYEAWKLRELKRIKRDKEEREAREKEQEEIERRRNMSEEQRLAEDMERVKEQREKKPHGQYKFLQKYYHKGAFYLNPDDDIFKRDYTTATPDEAAHKELLPKVMQVKNFGRAGQTKWTHLADQDTSKKDAAWSQNSGVNKSMLFKLGGLHGGFDKPTSKKRRTG
ncbi:splicing factor, Prp19-binding domain-containing protein [Gigaspora rosea]|uniref:Splicing factor, Prp19-binding domain-containing protein n=1 Tax=Gigaspora rosea TaxID=44941 RepID=A0A397V5N9_9GLOM|nr:splicing factor, Prp19-binding domain-containing protein [Gigaspora rosea]